MPCQVRIHPVRSKTEKLPWRLRGVRQEYFFRGPKGQETRPVNPEVTAMTEYTIKRMAIFATEFTKLNDAAARRSQLTMTHCSYRMPLRLRSEIRQEVNVAAES